MSPMELIEQLVEVGGAIVSTNDCSEMEIAQARVDGRFTTLGAFGFVRRTKEWLELQKAREVAHPNTDGRYGWISRAKKNFKCATFDQSEITPEIRALMNEGRRKAEQSETGVFRR